MIDIHSHLLPKVDDGPSSNDEFLVLLNDYVDNGVTDVLCSPHYKANRFEMDTESIMNQFNESCELALKLGVKLHLWREVMIDSSSVSELKKGSIVKENTPLLIEFKPSIEFDEYYLEDLLYSLKLYSSTVVLAHVERYVNFSIKNIERLTEMGYKLQVNSNGLLGGDGKSKNKKIKKLLKKELISYIGSDIHKVHQKVNLALCKEEVSKYLSAEYVEKLFKGNQEELLKELYRED